MPRDISGNYTLPAGNPVVNGTIIDVLWANPTMADIATQLNNVVTRDGVLGMLAPLYLFGTTTSGTALAPALSFTADTSTGIYRPSFNVLAISSGAGQVAQFISAGSGTANYFEFTSSATLTAPILYTRGSDTNISLQLQPKGTGGVGVNVATPLERLHISGNIQQENANYIKGKLLAGTVTRLFGLTSGDALYIGGIDAAQSSTMFLRGGTVQATLDASGNVGLGVTPSAWFASSRAIQIGSAATPYLSLAQQTTSTSDGYLMWGARLTGDRVFAYQTTGDAPVSYRQNSGTHSWHIATSGTAGNPITFTQAMTLDASGNLGVGLSTLTEKFSVAGSGRFTSNASGFATGAEGACIDFVPGSAVRIGHVNGAAGTAKPIQFLIGGNPSAYLDASGYLGIGIAAPTVHVDANGAIRTRPVTVATLPSASTAGAGSRHFVTDSNATTFAAVVAGGGANGVPVYSDGTNWRIG